MISCDEINLKSLLKNHGADFYSTNIDSIKDLFDEYRSRPYHGISHLYHMVYHLVLIQDWMKPFSKLIDDQYIPDIIAAILIHDLAPTPQESLTRAYELGIFLSVDSQLVVKRLVMATDHSKPPRIKSTNFHLQVIHDLDLFILAGSRLEYEKYMGNIRAEYASKYSKTEFYTGRLDFLKRMLRRKYIFCHEYFRDMWDRYAFDNLKYELDMMTYYPGNPVLYYPEGKI